MWPHLLLHTKILLERLFWDYIILNAIASILLKKKCFNKNNNSLSYTRHFCALITTVQHYNDWPQDCAARPIFYRGLIWSICSFVRKMYSLLQVLLLTLKWYYQCWKNCVHIMFCRTLFELSLIRTRLWVFGQQTNILPVVCTVNHIMPHNVLQQTSGLPTPPTVTH